MKVSNFCLFMLLFCFSMSSIEVRGDGAWSLENLLATPPLRGPSEESRRDIANVDKAENVQVVTEDSEAKEEGFFSRLKSKAKSMWTQLKNQFDSNKKVADEKSIEFPNRKGIENATSDIKKELNEVKSQNAFSRIKGRAADSKLSKTKSGVATFRLNKKSSRSIPKLDIGVEDSISQQNFEIGEIKILEPNIYPIQVLSSPLPMKESVLKQVLGKNIVPVEGAKKIDLASLAPDKRVTLEKVKSIVYKINKDAVVHEKTYAELSPEEFKVLKALIYVEYGNKCHTATGLLNDVSGYGDAGFKNLVNFHMAVCLHKMGLFTEATEKFKLVLNGSSNDYKKRALQEMFLDLPKDQELELVRTLRELPSESIPKNLEGQFYYRIAKASARLEHFNNAKKFAERVKKGEREYYRAQFVQAVAEYSLGERNQSYDRLTRIQKEIGNKGDKDFISLVALNLGRMAFERRKIKTSIDNFNKIGKDHPLWIQALTEQGWMQLLVKDAPGAIGNMYSLHSPYFRAAYKPETYVIRTIGYLNLCQFGDARSSLEYLEKTHGRWLASVKKFRKSNKSKRKYYQTMVGYLRNTKVKSYKGLPHQILREMGRQKEFLNLQEAVNARVDEINQYSFIERLIQKDRNRAKWYLSQTNKRIRELKASIKKAEKVTKLAKNINEWKRQIAFETNQKKFLKFEISVLEESKKSFGKYRKYSVAKLRSIKSNLQASAGQVLRRNLSTIQGRLRLILSNNEFLRYEVLAGSGENIRYLSSGGKGRKGRVPASAVNKDLNWNFDGEIWEDEIGHYRSSLKDMCSSQTARR